MSDAIASTAPSKNSPEVEKLIASLSYPAIPEHLLDPGSRHDVIFVFDCERGNPNGDPDYNNMPRTTLDGRGLVTDVCIKSKIRHWAASEGKGIFIQPRVPLNNFIVKAFIEAGIEPAIVQLTDDEMADDELVSHLSSLNGYTVGDGKLAILISGKTEAGKTYIDGLLFGKGGNGEGVGDELRRRLEEGRFASRIADALKLFLGNKKNTSGVAAKAEEARAILAKTYFDVRMFGAVLSTGLNAGQVRGAFQFGPAASFHRVDAVEMAITRQAKTTASRAEKGPTEFGRKTMLTYGLYKGRASYSPFLGQQQGVTGEDLAVMWRALQRMFSIDQTAARGIMAMRAVLVMTHVGSKAGFARTDQIDIRGELKPGVDSPSNFDDYILSTVLGGQAIDGIGELRMGGDGANPSILKLTRLI